ncbi:MobF family relaxase [Phytomonospora endophytica]|uniref:Conjugative relaxase-like TrwC/TraI family protein n=1 Tax=Phytomonospora endophytica TaxID=714109 RepID=A0A841FNR1_9ACTN|nr:MobF family relaxase [Phytomonospora endophytica]MBB6037725.1 conjugative relaxase-like TrwC/TraI family protein [Phytomonospora endophytica]
MHKLTAGDGYTYLTRHVAGGDVPRLRGQDAADYYTARGNPPGMWLGSAVHLLGVDGTVTEAQMKALFGSGMHPNADAMIRAYLAEHLHAGLSKAHRAKVLEDARKAATLGATFAVYKSPENYEQRVAMRLEQIAEQTGRAPTAADEAWVRRQEAGTSRAGVAGYDLVFTPVKSASILWGLHPDAAVRKAIGEAHAAAVASSLALVEEHAAFTRTGKAGIAQVDSCGLIAASFDHFDNRNGDPNLHTHIVVANKVRVNDGQDEVKGERWRTLDARALYRITVAASEHYSTSFQQQMTRRLGAVFEQRGDTLGLRSPVMEVAGVPTEAIWLFSSRREQLTERLAELLQEYRTQHGHTAPANVRHALARRANLETREAKKQPRSLREMQAQWRDQAVTAFGPEVLDHIAAAIPTTVRHGAAEAVAVDVDQVAARVVAEVAEYRSTWTEANLHAHTERVLRTQPGLALTPRAHRALAAQIVRAAASPAHSISLAAPTLAMEPEGLRRADGESVFAEHGAGRYTSRLILDAEERLVAAAKTPTTKALTAEWTTGALDGIEAEAGTEMDAGQRHLVEVFATDGRFLVAGLGPAGAGKTTAMRAYTQLVQRAGRRVIPLATSTTAAAALGKELDTPADSVHKFLHEHCRGTHAAQLAAGEPVPEDKAVYRVRSGDVILVDEAGMAGTLNLDRICAIAHTHGATVRLLGDHRQLGAVESGGALALICNEAGAVELTTLHRFTDPGEAEASLKLRIGDTAGLDYHQSHGRITGGEHDAMIDAVYTAWHSDMRAGKTTIMLAAAAQDVTALSARARADRVAAGLVQPGGPALRDGNEAGMGDWIVTRDNDRRLSLNGGKDFVRNGDLWRILHVTDTGGLVVEHLGHQGCITLPAAYVDASVELAYAATVMRAQGTTVDTVHALITPQMRRENLYVAATRGRDGVWFYTVTHHRPDHVNALDASRRDPHARTPREILDAVVSRAGNEQSATETIRATQDDAVSLATLVPQYIHALTEATTETYRTIAGTVLGPEVATAVTGDEAFGALVNALNRGGAVGWQPQQLLAEAARSGPLRGHDHPAALLAGRANALVRDLIPPAPLSQPTAADAARYARLIRGAHTRLALAPDAALTPPIALTAGDPANRAQYASVPKQRLDTIAETVAAHLGLSVEQVVRHRAWPHLAATLTSRSETTRLVEAYRGTHDLTSLARTTRALHRHDPNTPVRIPNALRHQHHTTIALDPEHAEDVRTSRYWPALAKALSAAEKTGIDPVEALRRATANHRPDRAFDPALDLATGVHRQAHLHSTGITSDPTETWRQIAWMLKAHTEHGGNPTDVAYRVRTTRDLTELRDHIAAHATHPSHTDLPAWIPATPNSALHEHWRAHLTDSATAINDRISHLTDTVLATHPAWASALGQAPTDPVARRTWQECVGVIAAYRDQFQITSNDPAHPLGAYPEQGRTGHGAYLHATTALIHAHALTTATVPPQGGPNPPTGLGANTNDRIRHHLTATIYRSLPGAEQNQIAAAVQDRFGAAWIQAAPTTEAVTDPAYGPQLLAALTEQGHLAQHAPAPRTAIPYPIQPRQKPRTAPIPDSQTRSPQVFPAPVRPSPPAPSAPATGYDPALELPTPTQPQPRLRP